MAWPHPPAAVGEAVAVADGAGVVRAIDPTDGLPHWTYEAGGGAMVGGESTGSTLGMSSVAGGGAAAAVGAMQTAGNNDGDRGDVVDVLKYLVECCKDG